MQIPLDTTRDSNNKYYTIRKVITDRTKARHILISLFTNHTCLVFRKKNYHTLIFFLKESTILVEKDEDKIASLKKAETLDKLCSSVRSGISIDVLKMDPICMAWNHPTNQLTHVEFQNNNKK